MVLRRVGIGQVLFASSFALIGAVSLGFHDFLLYQQPVPPGIPWREPLACLSAALLLLAGLGLLFPATVKGSALTLSGFVALWVVALWIPKVLAHPEVEANWLGVGEDLTLVVGGWLIYCAAMSAGTATSVGTSTSGRAASSVEATPTVGATPRADPSERGDATVRIARILFGVALVPIGLSHFFYLKGAANFIPAWMPFHVPLTMLAGAGHVAAGLAIALGVVPRLAATTEAGMESLITLIVWVSAIAAKPADHHNWVNLLISSAETAAAWVVAASYARPVALTRAAPREALSE